MIKTLISECEKQNIALTGEAIEKFEFFAKIMLEENEKYNLTAIKEPKDIAILHFADCLTPLSLNLFFPGAKVIDVGCGAGFPSFPLKFVMDDLSILQLDSLLKRVNFLNMVSERLNLSGISAIHARAEELSRDKTYREAFDFAVSRAVANLPALLELCLPFVKVGGYFIAMKGNNYKDELLSSENACKALGASYVETCEAFVGDEVSHHLIVFKKTEKTPEKYPRRGSKISKNPIL